MLKIRKSEDRGLSNHGWLHSRHTFSFAEYYDPEHLGFRNLRVINDDRIAGGTGFAAHPHSNMEIISYVVQGSLAHADSMGNKTVIYAGEVQKMSAGSGVVHSEHNAEKNEEAHFFQVWIRPFQAGGIPSYEQRSFAGDFNNKSFVLVVSEDGRDGSISIKQDADMYIAKMKKSDEHEFVLRERRGCWVQVVQGHLLVNDQEIMTGDALSADATEENQNLKFNAIEDSEFILFDL